MEFNPDDFYGKIAGSTMTGDSTMTSEMKTNSVTFPDGTSIKGNSLEYTENRYDKSASSYALYQGLSKLQENINTIDPDSHFLLDHTVITRDMIDPHFIRDEYAWDISTNWTVVDGTATLVGEDNNNNYLKISNRAFTGIGYYYLNVHPTRLDSGTIRVYDNFNTLVGEVRATGETVIELYITNIEIMTLTFVAEDMIVGDIITLDSIHLHKVTDRFRTYLNDKLSEHGLTTEIVDKEQCAAIAAGIVDDAVRTLMVAINTVNDEMLAHIADRGNVHGLTADDLDVARRDHTHAEFSLFGNDLGSMADHIADIHNPHNVTPTQIGAAYTSHIHLPIECGAAPEVHEHVGQYTTLNDHSVLSNRVTNLERYSSVGSASKAAVYPYMILDITNQRYDVLPTIGDINKYVVPPYNLLQTPMYLCKAYETLFKSIDYYGYNYFAGSLTCSRESINGNLDVFRLVNKPGTINSATFDTTGPTEIILELNGLVSITGYTLCKRNRTNEDGIFVTAGYPSNIKLYGDGELISEKVLIENFVDSIHFDIPTSFFKQLRIVTTEQILSTEDDTWDFGIQLHQENYVNLSGVAINMLNATSIVKDVFTEYPEFTHPLDSTVYVFVKDVGETYEIITDSLPPDFDNRGIPVSILEDGVDKDGLHPLWGSIVATNEDADYPIREAISITEDDSHFRSTVYSNVVITQSFQETRPLRNLNSIYFEWSADMIKYNFIPKGITISVKGKKINADSTIIDTEEDVYVNEDFEYIEYTDGVKLSVDLTQINIFDIVKIRIEFNPKEGREEQIIVALEELKIMGTPWWADPYTGITSDISMMPIGRVINTSTNETNSDGELVSEYVNIPYANSRIMYVPLNSARATNMDNFIFNPFGTLEIDITCLYLVDDKFVLCPDGKIEVSSITVDKIQLDIKTATDTKEYVYLIKVVRRW